MSCTFEIPLNVGTYLFVCVKCPPIFFFKKFEWMQIFLFNLVQQNS